VILGADGAAAVLDWVDADLGDPHADVGTTLMLLACGPAGVTSFRDRLAIKVGRSLLARWYLRAYRAKCPLSDARLNYYRAWAAFRRLCRYGRCLRDGPESEGFKPSVLRQLTPDHIGKLERYFAKWTGVTIRCCLPLHREGS